MAEDDRKSHPCSDHGSVIPKKLGKADNRDSILAIPTELQHYILGKLPIEDQVRTSFLSRNWRDKWVDVPSLTFEEVSGDQDRISAFVRKVYVGLLSHRGKVCDFSLRTSVSPETIEMDLCYWLQFLARNLVENVNLDFEKVGEFSLSSVAICRQLKGFTIRNGAVWCPKNSPVLDNLTSLKLVDCSTRNDSDLEEFVNCSPNLEVLILKRVTFGTLTLDCPKLITLYYEGRNGDVVIKTCPLLTMVSMMLLPPPDHGQETQQEKEKQGQVWITNLRKFSATGSYLKKFLSTSWSCQLLMMLHIEEINFHDSDVMVTMIQLLRSCVNLTSLKLKGFGTRTGSSYMFGGGSHCIFKKLSRAKISIVRAVPTHDKAFFDLVRLVITCSPELEVLDLKYQTDEGDALWLLKKLLLLERASSKLILKIT